MVNYREMLRLNHLGQSQRSIAAYYGSSRKMVSDVLTRASDTHLAWPLPENMQNEDIFFNLLYPERAQSASLRILLDCEHIHRELAKHGVTLSLPWNEYCESCRVSNDIPLMYSQCCNYYHKFAASTKATMHIQRKPGEHLEVDWAGQQPAMVNTETGERIPIYVFLASLSSSQYAYVEGFLSMDQES